MKINISLRWLPMLTMLATLFLTTHARANEELPPLQTVDFVDLERYLGTWYEIASIPQSFQEGCENSKAQYSQMRSGKIRVVNTCTIDGRIKRARGKAWVVDKETNAKLKVQFFWPFKGDYWIIDLDKDYQFAVVGAPNRDYLWILSRSKTMSNDLYNKIMNRIANIHLYDTTMIERTSQTER
jgi:apolipoprotein D and lipocalin family protein